MNQEKIGKFIAKLRGEKNMTQQELANKIGVTDRAISKWENGRGMPDLSLMEPLCKELDITINELLSGEKVKKEEYQKKLEENILNTINYSTNKITKNNKKFKIIITACIIILFSICTMFLIDIGRMNQNKPVLFSTWGFKYTPTLNIDASKIDLAIRNYLIEKLDNEPHHNPQEKSFTSMKVFLLDKEKKETLYYVYAWVMEGKYYLEDGELKQDSASSIPYKFIVEKVNDEYKVIDSRIPRDGSYYKDDLKNIFPRSVRTDIDNCQFDGTIEKLKMELEEQAKLYFHI